MLRYFHVYSIICKISRHPTLCLGMKRFPNNIDYNTTAWLSWVNITHPLNMKLVSKVWSSCLNTTRLLNMKLVSKVCSTCLNTTRLLNMNLSLQCDHLVLTDTRLLTMTFVSSMLNWSSVKTMWVQSRSFQWIPDVEFPSFNHWLINDIARYFTMSIFDSLGLSLTGSVVCCFHSLTSDFFGFDLSLMGSVLCF